jgi:hypothetical protein
MVLEHRRRQYDRVKRRVLGDWADLRRWARNPTYAPPGTAARVSSEFPIKTSNWPHVDSISGFLRFVDSANVFSSWIQALIGGTVLFYTQFKSQGSWIRNTECRPMKPMLLSSVVLMILIVAAYVDIFLL